MVKRTTLLDAGRRASEVWEQYHVRQRIEQEGYTRVDPVRIAEEDGVAVMFQPMEQLLGAYVKDERPGIIVNVARGPGLIHMTCAHELGHHFLGHAPHFDTEINYATSASAVEQQADQFAYSLLAPVWLIKRILTRKNWDPSSFRNPDIVYQLSLRLGTSYTSAVWSLARLKLISPADATRLAGVQPKQLKNQLMRGVTQVGNGDVWLLDERDRDWILEPHAQDVFVFELPNNATSGYVWSLNDVEAKGYTVQPVMNDVRVTPVTEQFGNDPKIGADRSLRFIVSSDGRPPVEHEGRTEFKMFERRPWGAASTDDDSACAFNAEYELLAAGLDRRERMRRVEEARTSA